MKYLIGGFQMKQLMNISECYVTKLKSNLMMFKNEVIFRPANEVITEHFKTE